MGYRIRDIWRCRDSGQLVNNVPVHKFIRHYATNMQQSRAQSLGSHDRLHSKFFAGGVGKFYPRGPKELAKSLSSGLLTDLHTQAAVRASLRYADTTSRLHSKPKLLPRNWN